MLNIFCCKENNDSDEDDEIEIQNSSDTSGKLWSHLGLFMISNLKLTFADQDWQPEIGEFWTMFYISQICRGTALDIYFGFKLYWNLYGEASHSNVISAKMNLYSLMWYPL